MNPHNSPAQHALDVAMERALAHAMLTRPAEVRWVRPSSWTRRLLGDEAVGRLMARIADEDRPSTAQPPR